MLISKIAVVKVDYNNLEKSPLGSLLSIKMVKNDDTSLTAISNNESPISTYTVIWTAGVTPESIIQNVSCQKDKKGRLVTNEYLQAIGFDNVFAVGDCASIIDPLRPSMPSNCTACNKTR